MNRDEQNRHLYEGHKQSVHDPRTLCRYPLLLYEFGPAVFSGARSQHLPRPERFYARLSSGGPSGLKPSATIVAPIALPTLFLAS